MAARKRDDAQRAADMQVLVKLKHQGWAYEDIQKHIKERTGRELSVRQLKYDMAHQRDLWAKQNVEELTKMRNEELARLEAMEEIAWRKFYACTGTHRKETVKQDVPKVEHVDEDGRKRMVPDYGVWRGKEKVVVTEDSTDDEKFWWTQILNIQTERRRVEGLYRTNIKIEGDFTHKVKGYVGWTPATWDGDPKLEVVDVRDDDDDVIDGEIKELTDGSE